MLQHDICSTTPVFCKKMVESRLFLAQRLDGMDKSQFTKKIVAVIDVFILTRQRQNRLRIALMEELLGPFVVLLDQFKERSKFFYYLISAERIKKVRRFS